MEASIPSILILIGLAFAFGAGQVMDEFEAGPLLLIPAGVLMFVAMAVFDQGINERWSDWSVCEDNVTQIESVIIADCDEYYKYPGAPDE